MNVSLSREVLAPPIPEFKAKAQNALPVGTKLYDLSQAVPPFSTFPAIRDAVRGALNDDETSFYTELPGWRPLREKLATTHPALSEIGADRILITAGANHAMYTALMLLLNPGDYVALLEPFYFNYDMALSLLGLRPAYFSMSEKCGMQLEAGPLIDFLKQNERVRAVILITPNNPTGASYSPEAIVELLAWTSTRGIEVILDETYRDFDEDPARDQRLASYVGRGLSLVGSFSKSYSLTGYRVGYLALGDEGFAQALKIQDTMIICAPRLSQVAAWAGLKYCQDSVRTEAGRLNRLQQSLRTRFDEVKHFSLVSSGGFFAYVRHPFGKISSEEAALELVRNTGILGLPGSVFGRSQSDYLRFSVANLEEDSLMEALDRLAEFAASADESPYFGKRN